MCKWHGQLPGVACESWVLNKRRSQNRGSRARAFGHVKRIRGRILLQEEASGDSSESQVQSSPGPAPAAKLRALGHCSMYKTVKTGGPGKVSLPGNHLLLQQNSVPLCSAQPGAQGPPTSIPAPQGTNSYTCGGRNQSGICGGAGAYTSQNNWT